MVLDVLELAERGGIPHGEELQQPSGEEGAVRDQDLVYLVVLDISFQPLTFL